ncbi:MAG: hypothetical protein MJK14_22700, partial [Rivularia sp. ALOHA_DT_140]|nr:hypothetical protein [Rivularia sp. ALOHA_DT_140]
MFELGVAINISEYLSRRNMKFLPIVATIVALSITTSAYGQLVPSNSFKTKASSIPKVQVIENQTKLRIYNGNKINNIPVNSLKVRVLDSNTCENKQVKRQTLSGKKLLTQAIKFNQRTGNLVVGVLLQDCLRKNLSAVFILEPKPNWNNYVVHRVAVPGKRQINNRFSTYPLGKIKAIGFRDLQVINCPTVSQNFRAKPRRVVVSLDRATPT